jgi:Glycosyl hydrolases family 16
MKPTGAEQRPGPRTSAGISNAFMAVAAAAVVVLAMWLLVARASDDVKGGGGAPSGVAMPVRDLPGWHQVFRDDFVKPARTGSFPGRAYRSRWHVYPDGWKDTTGHGTYEPSKVLSVHDGVLDWYIHSSHGRHFVAAPLPDVGRGGKYGGRIYGRYAIRFRASTLHGYKTAFLLWPDSNQSSRDGEIDFPEGNLSGDISAHAHYAGPSDGQASFPTRKGYSHWHTAVIKWLPGRIVFTLDGRVIGRSTRHVPHAPMHWVLQAETSTTPGVRPRNSTNGHIQVDWVAVWAPT